MAKVAAGSANSQTNSFSAIVLSFFQVFNYDLVGFRVCNELKFSYSQINNKGDNDGASNF